MKPHYVFTSSGPVLKSISSEEALTNLEVKRHLHALGTNLKTWAAQNGYSYILVSNVVRGVNKATLGKGYEIAVKLGMQPAPKSHSEVSA